VNGDDVEAIKQVFPETALRHQLLKIPVSRRNHPHIHHDGFLASLSFDDILTQNSKQLGLEGEG
jgi:hypothetical protein